MTYDEFEQQSFPIIMSDPGVKEVYYIFKQGDRYLYWLFHGKGINIDRDLTRWEWDNRGWFNVGVGVDDSLYSMSRHIIRDLF